MRGEASEAIVCDMERKDELERMSPKYSVKSTGGSNHTFNSGHTAFSSTQHTGRVTEYAQQYDVPGYCGINVFKTLKLTK